MKRCPQCRRDYYDESLLFCLDDGATLLSGPGIHSTSDQTIAFSTVNGPFESGTMLFGRAEMADANTIAVLPFLNLSSEEDSGYFSDGLAEELLNVLSKIKGLRVAARTSAFSFKDRSSTIHEIGNILKVASVLEGSVRKAGQRVRISVQLVKVVDGYQLWSETYDRTMDDIFAVQDDIAQSVVEEIRVRLLGEGASISLENRVISEVKNAVRGRSDNPEAQRLLMLGRHFLDKTTRDDTVKAIGYFTHAVEIDPEFALCWAELGRARSIEVGHDWIDFEKGFELSREAVDKALAIEPDLAEAHAQLGRIKAVHDWDLSGAEGSYKRALELAPGSSSVLDGASILYYKLGRLDEAISLGRQVLEQDPLSTAYWHNLGLTCHTAGRFDESEKAFLRALELAPQRFVTHALLSLVLWDEGDRAGALEQAQNETDPFWRLWALTIIHWLSGEKEKADELLTEIINEHSRANAYQIAEIFAVRGENDKAFEWLTRAVDEHDTGVTHAKVNPRLGPLHADPRWPDLLARIGF
jgi:TolB-like protein/tetratricopeptide (TPR) repeat protein